MDFKSPYNRSQYINFFRNQLLTEDFEDHEEEISISFKPQRIQKIVKIGEARSLDLTVYEIKHESENDPRVLISRDAFRFMAQYGVQKALILFISKQSSNFRLSLVTIDLKWEEGKRIEKEYSNPRRYSFFLGPDTKTHTPEEYLIKEGRVKDFEDLKKRFSIEVVNKEFYRHIAILFTKFAGGTRRIGREKWDEKGLLKLPSTSDDTLKKEFSVRLIGRLVFCWFLKKKSSDKGISLLPEKLLSSEAVAKTRRFYHSVLEPLFFAVLNTPVEERDDKYKSRPWSEVPFLNGGLFTPGHHDFYDIDRLGVSKHLNTLIVPDSWLKELFEIFETYNFTIDENTSVDVELSIEPEMLGRIFENLLAEINPETGETARKATGSYYTPRPIVEYMVDQSLKQYLLSNIPPLKKGGKGGFSGEDTISKLLSYHDWDIELTDAQKEGILDALDNIKIIDPACGSGAFPMGILQKMLLILQKVDPQSKSWLLRQLAKIENKVVKKELEKKLKRENWDYVHKLGIIQSSIYGVDIQPIAVEISKLRFFLSLIVDESIDDKKPNRGIVPLPNLEFKFVAANSLIGLPEYKKEETVELFEATDDIAKLKELRDSYFTSYGEEKKRIEKEFEETQKRMFERSIGWKSSDSQTMKLSQWSPFSDEAASWFDPEWMFGIASPSCSDKGGTNHNPPLEKGGKGGFDVVIANPPYVRQEKIKHIKPALKKEYDKFFCGTADIYTYFYKRGIDLLKEKGHLCFIAPNKFMRAGYGKNLRKLLSLEVAPKVIVDFCELPVFEAGTDPAIILVENIKVNNSCFKAVIIKEANEIENVDTVVKQRSFILNSSDLSDEGWSLEHPSVLALINKIKTSGVPLGEYVKGRFYYGIKTGLNDAFVIDDNTRSRLTIEDPRSEEIIKSWLDGHDILKWKGEWDGRYVIAIASSTNRNWPWSKSDTEAEARKLFKKTYPAIHDHLSKWEDRLRKRDDQGKYWWELRSCSYYDEFEQSKIIFNETSKELHAYVDYNNIYINKTGFIIVSYDNEYVVGILNSRLMDYYFRQTFPAWGDPWKGGRVQFRKDRMISVPIVSAGDKQKNQIIERVETILSNPDSPDVPRLEEEIDQLVYKLYNLTPEEIEIMEGRS